MLFTHQSIKSNFISASKGKSTNDTTNSSEIESFERKIGVDVSSEDSSPRWEYLDDAYRWDIIEYNKVVPIFEILPVDLKNQVLEILGQKILGGR